MIATANTIERAGILSSFIIPCSIFDIHQALDILTAVDARVGVVWGEPVAVNRVLGALHSRKRPVQRPPLADWMGAEYT